MTLIRKANFSVNHLGPKHFLISVISVISGMQFVQS